MIHQNIEFTYELKQNAKINFLDVMLIRMNDTLQTTIYRKSTHNGLILHWNSFALRTWKHNTLRTILIRAYKICSTKELSQNELKQNEEEFIKINRYPKWVFDQVNEKWFLKMQTITTMLQQIMKVSAQPADSSL